jgi:hypothetical protein
MAWFTDLLGTSRAFFRLGFGGPRLKDAGGNLAVRNPGDTADAQVTASKVNVSGDDVVVNSDAAGAGADWTYTLRRPAAGMTAAVLLTLPVDDGAPSQVLQTDGAGVLSWVSAGGSVADLVHVDTTTLGFGSAATVAMFTLPVGAVVHHVDVIVDTAFNGAPTASVGPAGSASKYVAATDIDLTQAAETRFRVHPGKAPLGTTEALQIAYAAGGATAGSARVEVAYSNPA